MMNTVRLRVLQAVVAACAIIAAVTLTVGIGAGSALPGIWAAWSRLAPLAPHSRVQAVAVGELPDVQIETASGERTSFAATNGRVRIATMFYAHCPGVCPMTIASLQRLESQLNPAERARVQFVLLSLDPARDSPQVLRSLARTRGIESPAWLIGRTSPQDAQRFAAAANIRYRRLSDGSVDHSSAVLLLDARGNVVSRASDADEPTSLLAALRGELGDSHGGR